MLIVGDIGSPKAGGRTRVAVDAMLRGAAEQGANTSVCELAEIELTDVIAAMDGADAVVFGSPTYRADISAQLKAPLDPTGRGMAYESGDPLRGTVCATVLTGASDHHFLAAEKVRGILGGFFGAQLLSPGLYLPAAAFIEDGAQMTDAEAVMERVPRRDGVSYAGLILNRKGLDRAVGAGVDEANVVVCVSDTFSARNQNQTADEAMRMADEVVSAARGPGLFTTITLATAFGCPFEGEVEPARVAEFARRAADAGVQELCLADTVGVGAPSQVHDLTARFRDTAP